MPSPAIRKATALDIAVIVMLAAIWGSVFPAIKVGVAETGPLWLVAIRTGLAALILLPWVVWRGFLLPETARQWRFVCGIAILNVAVPFSLIAWAQQSIDASVTAVLLGAGPFFALLVSHVTTKDDRISPLKALAMAIGFSGVVLIFANDLRLDASAPMQKIAVLGASLSYTLSGALSRKVLDVPPTRLAFLVFAINGLVFLPLALVAAPMPQALSREAVLALIYVGLVPTGLATILRFHIIRSVGLTYYAQGMNLVPVFGVALGVLLVDEKLTLALVFGLVLILTGLAVARQADRSRGTPPDKPVET